MGDMVKKKTFVLRVVAPAVAVAAGVTGTMVTAQSASAGSACTTTHDNVQTFRDPNAGSPKKEVIPKKGTTVMGGNVPPDNKWYVVTSDAPDHHKMGHVVASDLQCNGG